MTSAQVVETSVNVISNSPSQDYTHPDDRTLLYDILVVIVLTTTAPALFVKWSREYFSEMTVYWE